MPSDPAPGDLHQAMLQEGTVILPLFLLGRSYALVTHAEPIAPLSPLPAGEWLWGGVLLTALVSGFVVLLVNRGTTLEQRAREQALDLEERAESFRRQFQVNTAVMLLIDPADGHIRDCNDAAVRFYGYDRQRMQTLAIHDINTASREVIQAAITSVSDAQGTHFEFRHRLADGSVHDVEVFSTRILYQGTPALHSIIIDVTERERAEAQLRESEANFRTFFESMDDLVFVADHEGRLLYTNPAVSHKLGILPRAACLHDGTRGYIPPRCERRPRPSLPPCSERSGTTAPCRWGEATAPVSPSRRECGPDAGTAWRASSASPRT